ncbi:hypothetical protein [Lewinella sp. W8]|uniref:hypothetical protein n=1 Tax=Lewinella sp. W8 TaxID=2528208 RepID=UPI001067F704|nr:hypothetical protein [Lewinella sp. W8]MTB51798.1 hypothetical protein [Lewinella sp. W8]
MRKLILPLFILFLLFGCEAPADNVNQASLASRSGTTEMSPGHFSGVLPEYWYQGKAELNTYELEQIRYGEVHPGQATLIFVSEDFLTDKQVKNDNYTNPNSAPIIKTNMFRRFTTGLYDYSIMSSVFTPTATDKQPHTLKVTTSLQDWCGQTFTQLNYDEDKVWKQQLRSYFERENDQNNNLNADFLEDEIFNRIRMGWEGLPTGTFSVIPGTAYLLMTHKPYRAAEAKLSIKDYSGSEYTSDAPLKAYVIEYPSQERTVEIVFDAESPYVIRGWEENYSSRGKRLTTRAILTHQVMEAYWNLNGREDAPRRASLGLPLQ